MDYAEKAAENFKQGYNCAQSVVLAFCDMVNMDEQDALKLSSSFGGGMGRMREVCGACSGAFMIAGLLYGYADNNDDDKKREHYDLIQDIAKRFKNKNGTIICRELLDGLTSDTLPTPTPRTEEYYNSRPCVRFVTDAAEILFEIIKEKQI